MRRAESWDAGRSLRAAVHPEAEHDASSPRLCSRGIPSPPSPFPGRADAPLAVPTCYLVRCSISKNNYTTRRCVVPLSFFLSFSSACFGPLPVSVSVYCVGRSVRTGWIFTGDLAECGWPLRSAMERMIVAGIEEGDRRRWSHFASVCTCRRRTAALLEVQSNGRLPALTPFQYTRTMPVMINPCRFQVAVVE
jgi:hypothetical protein